MKWIDFKPTEGIVRAEGNGLYLSSTQIRATGCVVNIQKSEISGLPQQAMVIPTEDVDWLIFGYIPMTGLQHLTPHSYSPLNGSKYIERWIDLKGLSVEHVAYLKELGRLEKPLYGLIDEIPMLVAFFRQRGSKVVDIPAPFPRVRGILHSETCRWIFWLELHKFWHELHPEDKGDAWTILDDVLRQYQSLVTMDVNRWFRPREDLAVQDSPILASLEAIHDGWDYARHTLSRLLQGCEESLRVGVYGTVVATHDRHSVHAHKQAEANVTNNTNQKHGEDTMSRCETWDPLFAETVHLWFEALPDMHEYYQLHAAKWSSTEAECTYERFITMWVLAIFRGIC